MTEENTIKLIKPKILVLSNYRQNTSSVAELIKNNLNFEAEILIEEASDFIINLTPKYDLVICVYNTDMNFIGPISNIRTGINNKNTPIILITTYDIDRINELNEYDFPKIDLIFTPLVNSILTSKVNILLKAYYSEQKLNFVDSELKQIRKELKDQNRQLKHLALHDALTSTPNRYFFEKTTLQIIKMAKRYKRSFAALLLDIDNFKWINDKFGHNIGDEVIKAVANILKVSIRESDLVARLGGDEFGIILSEVKSSINASVVAQKILKAFELPLRIKQKSIRITLSIGITYFIPTKDISYEKLMEEADIAMYRAKHNGKNCFEYFANSMKDKYDFQNTINYELQNSVKRNEFLLNYQPIIDIQTKQIIGLEALLRWNNKKLGFVPPLDFIPTAEQTGMIYDIGLWVLESSCQQMALWKKLAVNNIFLSINISSKQIKNPVFGEDLRRITEKYGIEPKDIELELTESAFTADLEQHIKYLKGFKDRLSIDDFGAQYSSLSRLGKIPLRTLKIDGSLIQNISKYPKNKIIVKHLFQLAKELSLKVIAEQIASSETENFLMSLDCKYAQGYYYYKPMEASYITDLFGGNK